ncbi:MAG: hypothetical protein IJ777_02425 [Clostridia bacterium]|nr:hypothetical protein [Clostridia bacterium]
MARRKTYGESLSVWERQKDEAEWKRSLMLAIERRNFPLLEETLKEGLYEQYEFPNITCPTSDIKAIVEKYRKMASGD